MKLSSSTKILWPLNVVDAIERIKEQGYDGVEIWVTHIWRDVTSLAEFKTYLDALELKKMLHAPITDLNITSTDPDIRRVSLEKTAAGIELAASLGLDHFTMHPGRKSSGKDQTEAHWQQQKESMRYLLEVAAKHGVNLFVENMEKRSLEVVVRPDDVARLLTDGHSELLGITLDLAHVSTVGDIEIDDYIESVQAFQHVHLSDSKPGSTHAPLGEGTLDLPAIVSRLAQRYNGFVTLEGYVPGREMEVLRSNYNYWHDLMKAVGQESHAGR